MQQRFAVNDFFKQVIGAVIVVIAGLESDPGVAPGDVMELLGQVNFLGEDFTKRVVAGESDFVPPADKPDLKVDASQVAVGRLGHVGQLLE